MFEDLAVCNLKMTVRANALGLQTRAIGNPLTIGLAPKHMFRAGLCLLCLKVCQE